MDKKIAKKTWTVKRVATFGGIGLFVGFVAWQFIFADRRPTLKIDKDKITISEVRRGEFKEYIPQTGIVEPSRQVFLDAIEGGNIKKIVRESGAMLKAGDEILHLTNLNRELQVLQQEASFNESINRARETKLAIMRNDVEQQQTLAAIQNQLDILTPQYARQKSLFEKKLISKQDFERTEADYVYNVNRRKILYAQYRADSTDRVRSMKATELSEVRMMKSLDG